MGVYIPNIEMPKSCTDCRYDGCALWIHYEERCKKRHPNCPLVEVLPHGRLIDADTAYNQFLNLMDIQGAINPCQLGTILTNAPTIIESDENE